MTLPERMATVLATELGENTADVVCRHVCAKFGAEDGCESAVLQQVGDFLRRGLVAYVGADRARELADLCLEAAARPA